LRETIFNNVYYAVKLSKLIDFSMFTHVAELNVVVILFWLWFTAIRFVSHATSHCYIRPYSVISM